jgi:hypothetical protein
VNEREREQPQAEALDAYLTDLQSGQSADRADNLPTDQVSFLHALVDLGRANPPDADFASQLEAHLHTVARQRSMTRRSTRPRHWKALWGTERMMSMNRRLVFSMAGAVVLAMIFFAVLALLDQNKSAVGPGQVAQQPTSTATSVPTALPTATATSLLPTAMPTAALQETRPPTPTPTETALPTVAPTPTPMQPIVLPSLATWQETGYGGGGMGGPLSAKRTYVLGAALPEGPAQMMVYLQREPARLTASDAAQVAERLGLRGKVYQSIRLATVAEPDDELFGGYLAVDGAREVTFEGSGIVHYTDRNRTSFYEGCWNEPEGVPPLAQAVSAAEVFLRSAGMLEGEYEIASTGDMLLFYHVLEGQWLLVEPFASVYVWVDGQVGQVQYWSLTLDVLAEYPILSAQEAWDVLRADQPNGRAWQYLYRAPEMPPWGEWRHANPKFWARSYQAGQQAHRFGVPRTWFPTEAGGTPFLAIGDLVLSGDVQGLAEYALQQYAREQWNYVHVWGVVEDAGDHQVLRVEGWEPAEETYWNGTIRRQDGQGTLITDDGRTIHVPDMPDDLADGTQVSISGGQHGERLEWYVIQEMSYAVPPPDRAPSEVQMTVEQVDLVYLALAPNVIPPDRFADLGYRAVQPVWRFRGHSDQGEAFEVYVQAVQSSYVEK